MDECHFQQHGSRCVMWVPPEDKDPMVHHAPTRRSIALFGAVRVCDGPLVTLMTPVFDAASFEVFLKMLLRHRRPGRRIVLVLDNARYHHAKSLAPFLQANRKQLTLDYLPPYSPQLNPIERVWKLLRRLRTHNQYFEALEQLTEAVSEQLVLWKKPNSTLAKLCCIN